MLKGICTGLMALLLVNGVQASEVGPESALVSAGKKALLPLSFCLALNI